MIERIELRNITAFDKLELDLSPKINVIIGENGTGKTHLLKAAYGLCCGASILKSKPEIGKDELETAFTKKLLRLFMPLDDKVGKMHRQGASGQAYLSAQFSGGQSITSTFSKNSRTVTTKALSNYEPSQAEAVFIPTKEVLSFMKGFTSLYEKYGLSFDQTYQDVCLMLELPEIRPENLHERSKWAMTQIEGICGGRFVFHGGGKITFKTVNGEYSVNAMAEGFRKAGILSRLLETGAIRPGVSGPLFWDEPESNLNPKLIKTLVLILLELSRNGQQIVLTTHDYVLLKWFDLLADKNKNDHVRFHSLHVEPNTSQIKVASSNNYLEAAPNPIDEAFGFLINQEIENDMGGLREMRVVEADGFKFQFEDALDAFIFDETDVTKPTFHGAPMKGVDIVAEFEDAYVFVEVKDYNDPSVYDVLGATTEEEQNSRQDSFKWLKNYLKYKFRDSYLYRHAENKVEKPIHYVCLITFDNALNSRMQKSLKQELPVGKPSRRWVQALAKSCQVVNLAKWNENFPRWPVTRLTATTAGGN